MNDRKQAAAGWGESLRCAMAALCCWAAAWTFYVAWQTPLAIADGYWVSVGVGLLMVEFVAINSSMIVGELAALGRGYRRVTWAALTGYGLLALVILLAFDSTEITLVVCALMISRLHDVFSPARGRACAYGRRRAICSGLLFVLLGFATLLLPIGPGGITPELLQEVWPDRGGGIWEAEPQRALVMGLIYFLLLGWVELRPPSPEWGGG